MIRFIHCGDFHIDSQISADSRELSNLLKDELVHVFSTVCRIADEKGYDFVLISGDLFDRTAVRKEIADFVIACLEKYPGVHFVVSPGNHDYVSENSFYKRADLPKNLHVFLNESLEKISFEKQGVDIYGYAFTSPILETNPFAGKKPYDSNKINILLAHGDTDSVISKYCPITNSDITDSGFDYIALGHNHTNDGIFKTGQCYYGYCGTPLGHDFGECGKRGVYSVELEKENGIVTAKCEKLVLSPYSFETEELDISNCTNNEQIAEKLNSLISSEGFNEYSLLRIKLIGRIPAEFNPSALLIKEKASHCASLDIRDGTLPMYDEKQLLADPTIKGAFFEKLLPLLENGSREEREIAALALRFGLNALSGNPINGS